jgi:hypothetical protein
MEHRDDTGGWLYRMILAAWVMFIVILVAFAIKSVHHEFLHLPGIVACRRGEAMNLEITPSRVHGRMETFDLANCTFYWWESNRGGD